MCYKIYFNCTLLCKVLLLYAKTCIFIYTYACKMKPKLTEQYVNIYYWRIGVVNLHMWCHSHKQTIKKWASVFNEFIVRLQFDIHEIIRIYLEYWNHQRVSNITLQNIFHTALVHFGPLFCFMSINNKLRMLKIFINRIIPIVKKQRLQKNLIKLDLLDLNQKVINPPHHLTR